MNLHSRPSARAARRVIVCLLVFGGMSLRAADFDPYAGAQPLGVLIQTNPWAMVIGSDTPQFVVYDDGEVIFARITKERFAYYHHKLDPSAFEELKARIRPVTALPDLKPSYSLAHVTDQPRTRLISVMANAKLRPPFTR